MTTVQLGALTCALIVAAVIWRHTRKDPIYWLIKALIILRAVIAQGGKEIAYGVRRWWRLMPAAIDRSRRQCLEVE